MNCWPNPWGISRWSSICDLQGWAGAVLGQERWRRRSIENHLDERLARNITRNDLLTTLRLGMGLCGRMQGSASWQINTQKGFFGWERNSGRRQCTRYRVPTACSGLYSNWARGTVSVCTAAVQSVMDSEKGVGRAMMVRGEWVWEHLGAWT